MSYLCAHIRIRLLQKDTESIAHYVDPLFSGLFKRFELLKSEEFGFLG